jgi:hypothetical protein
MEIEYDRTPDDLIAFNLYHLHNTPNLKRQIRTSMGLYVILIASILLIIFAAGNKVLLCIFFTFSIIGGIGLFLSLPRYYDQQTVKLTKRLLAEGRNEGLIGHTKVILTPEAIVGQTSRGEEKLFWHSVNQVVETATCIYIYVSSMSAYIIPRRAFSSDEQRLNFISLVNQYYKDSTGQPLLTISQ